MKKIISVFLILFFYSNSQFAQSIIDTIYLDNGGIDAHTNSQYNTTNYGTDTAVWVYYDYGSPTKNYYGYQKADFSSIPKSAIVTNASVNLYALQVNNTGDHAMSLQRLTSSWTESGITYSNYPNATGTNQVLMTDSASSILGWQSYNATLIIQYQVSNPNLNYGWRILQGAQNGTLDKGVIYASTEHSNSNFRPYVIVEYHIPDHDTIYFEDTKDAFVYSGASTSNYGQDSLLSVGWNYSGTGYANRSFLYADLSHIDPSMIISNADIFLYAVDTNNAVSHPFYIEAVSNANWYEDSLKWSNQPSVGTAYRSGIVHATNSQYGWQEMDIINLAKYAVWSPAKNFGWRISLQSESGTSTYGVKYASAEHDSVEWRPYMVIEYVPPIEIDANVTHCTNGNNDGSIHVTSYSGGCGFYTNYSWRKQNGTSYTGIESGTDMSNIDVSGLSDGVYILEITDYRGVQGHKYFFVGEEGTTTTLTMDMVSTNGAKYCNDAFVVKYKNTGDSTTIGGSATTVGCFFSTTAYDGRSFTHLNIQWDPSLEFTEYDYVMRNKGGCIQYSNSDNDAWISRITEPWGEADVTWTTRPNVTTEGRTYIPTTTTNGLENRNDTVSILGLIPYWQMHPDENYGFELALNSYNQAAAASRNYSSSDYTGSNFIISFTVKPKIETVFYDSLGTGDITINAPSGELPYTYLIGYDTLPSMDSIWYAVKDSIPIDSTTFYRGRENTRNYTFANLPNDHYFVGVYDNNGVLIYSGDTYLTPTFEIYDSIDIDVDNDTLKVKSGETEGKATLFANLPIGESGGFEIEIVTLADDLAIGLDEVDDTFPSFTRDLIYALEITSSAKAYAYDGYVILDSVNVSVGDKLKMEIDDFGQISFYKNQEIFAQDSLSDTLTNDLKVQAYLKGAEAKAYFKMLSKALKKPKLKHSVVHAECGDNSGYLVISLPTYSYFSSSLNSYTIYDINNALVASGSTSGSIPLTPGIYTLNYGYNVGSGTYAYSTTIVIGYHLIWNSLTNLNQYSSPYNYTTPISYSTYGEGISKNKTDLINDEFILYTHRPITGPTVGFSYSNMMMQNGNNDPAFYILTVHAGFPIINKFCFVFDENTDLVTSFTPTLNPIRVNFYSNGDIEVYDNNTLKSSLNTTLTGIFKIDVYESKYVKLVEPVASFCYPQIFYVAKTKPELDGSYYQTQTGALTFQYTGEYNQSDLLYELIDEGGNTILSSSYNLDVLNSTGILKKNADNRYELDLSSLPGGYYLVVITNVKGEKHYLRVKN